MKKTNPNGAPRLSRGLLCRCSEPKIARWPERLGKATHERRLVGRTHFITVVAILVSEQKDHHPSFRSSIYH
jgi:hypothetical protein